MNGLYFLATENQEAVNRRRQRADRYGRLAILERSAWAVLTAGVETHKAAKIYVLFSGGHDSLVTTHVTSQHPAFAGVIHIDTGTGVPETQQFVRDVCKRYGWDLIIKTPRTTALMLSVEHGFPGPGQHGLMYSMLKERPLRQAKQEAARRSDVKTREIAYSTGVRSEESARRMGHVETMRKDKEGVWLSPVHDWTSVDLGVYMLAHDLPRNKVKDHTHMSGECLCGAYAQRSEARMWGQWFPEVGERIARWEALVKQARELQVWEAENGFRAWTDVMEEKYTRWGWKDRVPDAQMEMFVSPLCHACDAHHAGGDA